MEERVTPFHHHSTLEALMSFPSVRHSLTIALLALALPVLPVAAQGRAAAPAASQPEFTILIFERPSDLQRRTDAKTADAYWTAYDEFAGFLAQSGALRGGSALSESDRAVVRGKGSADEGVAGARLGGYFVIAAKDLPAARALAARAPSFAVTVEVRPHRPNPHMMAPSPRD
jgi:hypothetical protein